MHVNQVRLAEKTDSIAWEEQSSEWTAADTGSNEVENMIHQMQDFGRIAAADGENSKALRQMLMTRQGYLKKGAAVFFEEPGLCELQMAVCKDGTRHKIVESQRAQGAILQVIRAAERFILERTEGYSEKILHELLTNAFVHRDFNSTQCNEVLISEDHIEIFNPGAFPAGYEVEDFTSREQRPVPRNPLIARILYYMGCTDGIGTGLQKVSDICRNIADTGQSVSDAVMGVHDDTQAAGQKMDVSWQLDKGGVTVWLSGGRIKSIQPTDVNVNKNEKMILTYLETHDWLTNAAAREIVHVGTTAARSLLNGLVDRGYLRAEGENRGRKYYLAAKRPR